MKQSGKTSTNHEKGPDLKGTLISVGVLGLIIIISWAVVFAIFLSR
ncbi:cytochrome c oxidase subunit 2A [Oceanobacillus sp. FSL K6-2867]